MKTIQLEWKKIAPYNTDELDKYDLDFDGIYVISTLRVDMKYNAIYVGQGNIAARLRKHLSSSDENQDLYGYVHQYGNLVQVSIATVPSGTTLNAVEKFLYDKFNPRYNQISPPGSLSQAVNLPPDLVIPS